MDDLNIGDWVCSKSSSVVGQITGFITDDTMCIRIGDRVSRYEPRYSWVRIILWTGANDIDPVKIIMNGRVYPVICVKDDNFYGSGGFHNAVDG